MEQWEIEFIKAVQLSAVKEFEPLEYRLHYNAKGDIYMCSMQQHPGNTEYIVVTKEEYYNYSNYCVVSGKLKPINRNNGHRVRLRASTGGYQVVKNHAGLLLESNESFRETEYYARNN